MSNSGGIITYNLREGYRSESLAQYILSAFGPCIPITREDDYGIDLLCNLAERNGVMQIIKTAYGVQVKSDGTDFEFRGVQAIEWLLNFEFPFLLCVVNKGTASIEIFSTWNVNKLLLMLDPNNKSNFPELIKFVPDSNETLGEPTINGKEAIVPIGKPILSFNVTEIGDSTKRANYWKILNEWIELDSNNYRWRRAGFSSSFGYSKWTTNLSLNESQRIWFKNYFWNHSHYASTKKNIAEAAIISANFLKTAYESNKVMYAGCKNEFNSLRQYISNYCKEEVEQFGKGLFEKDLD